MKIFFVQNDYIIDSTFPADISEQSLNKCSLRTIHSVTLLFNTDVISEGGCEIFSVNSDLL